LIDTTKNCVWGSVTKEFNLPFVPVKGMEIQTHAWKNPRVVESVSASIDDDTGDVFLFVSFGREEWNGEEDLEQIASKMYELHGWETPAHVTN
jgi:hypothetical protein